MTTPANHPPIVQEVGPPFAEILSTLHADGFNGREHWSTSDFTTLLSLRGALCLLASVGGEPAGLLVARCIVDEAEILTIAVARPSRRRGVARALVQALQEHAQNNGVARIFLEVSVLNDAAKRLYLDTGFVSTGLRRHYYEDGSDAETMTYETPSPS